MLNVIFMYNHSLTYNDNLLVSTLLEYASQSFKPKLTKWLNTLKNDVENDN